MSSIFEEAAECCTVNLGIQARTLLRVLGTELY